MDNHRLIPSVSTCCTVVCMFLFTFLLQLNPFTEWVVKFCSSNGFVSRAPYMPVDSNLCIYHCAEEGTWLFMSKQTNFNKDSSWANRLILIKSFVPVTCMIQSRIIYKGGHVYLTGQKVTQIIRATSTVLSAFKCFLMFIKEGWIINPWYSNNLVDSFINSITRYGRRPWSGFVGVTSFKGPCLYGPGSSGKYPTTLTKR